MLTDQVEGLVPDAPELAELLQGVVLDRLASLGAVGAFLAVAIATVAALHSWVVLAETTARRTSQAGRLVGAFLRPIPSSRLLALVLLTAVSAVVGLVGGAVVFFMGNLLSMVVSGDEGAARWDAVETAWRGGGPLGLFDPDVLATLRWDGVSAGMTVYAFVVLLLALAVGQGLWRWALAMALPVSVFLVFGVLGVVLWLFALVLGVFGAGVPDTDGLRELLFPCVVALAYAAVCSAMLYAAGQTVGSWRVARLRGRAL